MSVSKKKGAKKGSAKPAREGSPGEACAIVFRCAAPADAQVFVAGSFNCWQSDTHALAYDRQSGLAQASITLPPGRHEYKFVVDGAWMVDPCCPDWVINDHGSLNSVVTV
jgi:1,4-alpha-glucan branching enzyme